MSRGSRRVGSYSLSVIGGPLGRSAPLMEYIIGILPGLAVAGAAGVIGLEIEVVVALGFTAVAAFGFQRNMWLVAGAWACLTRIGAA